MKTIYLFNGGKFTGTYEIDDGAVFNTLVATDIKPPNFDPEKDDLAWDGLAWKLDKDAVTRREEAARIEAEPSITDLRTAALAQVRDLRSAAFLKLDYMSIDALTDENLELAKQIKVTKLALRDITKADVSKCKSAADIANAYKAAWVTVAAAAPDSVKKLFAEALL
jgi:hypothetical protein